MKLSINDAISFKLNQTPDNKFPSDQLKAGQEVEKEHHNGPIIAKSIAKDHLSEIPDYYTRLKKMEKSAGVK